MRTRLDVLAAALAVLFAVASGLAAIPLTDEYSIAVATTQLDTYSYLFEYAVTNNNQEVIGGSSWTGLDGFFIQIPDSAAISNITIPPAYRNSFGYWTYEISTEDPIFNAPEAPLLEHHVWLKWWGHWTPSLYPIGTTATFSFQADNVLLGTASSVQVTHWNWETPLSPYVTYPPHGYYSAFSTELVAPVAIPEPAGMLLLGSAVAGTVALRRRKRRHRRDD